MKTKLTKSEWLDDWYAVKPPTGGGVPEGTADEWREILAAMKERQRQEFKRVAVKFDKDGTAWMWSPRNSVAQTSVHIAPKDVDEWIASAESVLSLPNNVKRVHPYQRGRTSITGFGL
jgi:hypothetical protein